MPKDATVVTTPFKLAGAVRTPLPASINQWLEGVIEKATGLETLDQLYRSLPSSTGQLQFLQIVLDLFAIQYRIATPERYAIPESGPVVIVSNHPFGGLEGVILAHHLLQRRLDVKFMANYMLERIPELRDLFIGVDPFGGQGARTANIKPLRAARQWLSAGGVLVVFPAGQVSHWHASRRQVVDPEWSPSLARLIRKSGATVVPVYFQGTNSLGFQLAGLLHPSLRTAMLGRELLNKKRRLIDVSTGRPIAAKQLKTFDQDVGLMRYLRLQTYSLARPRPHKRATIQGSGHQRQPIAAAADPERLSAELSALPAAQILAQGGGLVALYGRGEQFPSVLSEIGRLRELTFRANGEGTGCSTDLDRFDAYYLHLVVWDAQHGQIAGAYRLGLSEEILPNFGKRGFYTYQLFRYRSRLLHNMGPCIELGRSFVAPAYQKSYLPLMLLWKGIGAFVRQHPQYRVLFGPVSISADYQTSSQQLLVDFLRANRFAAGLAKFVHPRKPLRRAPGLSWNAEELAAIPDLNHIGDIIEQMECGDRSVPILLKQYLKLGGRLLGFNIDPDFNNALDGLIMVDLCETDRRTLEKYLGEEGAIGFLNYQSQRQASWRQAC